jgi:hypothetical protein
MREQSPWIEDTAMTRIQTIHKAVDGFYPLSLSTRHSNASTELQNRRGEEPQSYKTAGDRKETTSYKTADDRKETPSYKTADARNH